MGKFDNPKSRQHWAIGDGVDEEKWTKIFGKKAAKASHIVRTAYKDTPVSGDYSLHRDCNKTLRDYIKFKSKRDRAKINAEFHGKQAEYRTNKVIPQMKKEGKTLW